MTMVYKIVWHNIHTIVLLTLCIVQWYSQTIFKRVSSVGPVWVTTRSIALMDWVLRTSTLYENWLGLDWTDWELEAAELRFYLSPFIPENLQSFSDLLPSFPDTPCDRKYLVPAKGWTALIIENEQGWAWSQSCHKCAPDPCTHDPPWLSLSSGTKNDSSKFISPSYCHVGTMGK